MFPIALVGYAVMSGTDAARQEFAEKMIARVRQAARLAGHTGDVAVTVGILAVPREFLDRVRRASGRDPASPSACLYAEGLDAAHAGAPETVRQQLADFCAVRYLLDIEERTGEQSGVLDDEHGPSWVDAQENRFAQLGAMPADFEHEPVVRAARRLLTQDVARQIQSESS
ncbi:MAG: hypothetical protein WCJ30_08725 [Deltaproteobacteria bacterium]